MDWELAINRNREPLLRLVAALFAMIGLAEGGTVERLSRPLYRAVLALLRPAESAVRRLIIVAARDIVVKPSPVRPAKTGLKISSKSQGRRSFRLFDPRKRFEWVEGPRRLKGPRSEPRIHVFEVGVDPLMPVLRRMPPGAATREKDTAVNAQPLCRRLAAIKGALEDLPRQAMRYARWRAKLFAARRPKLSSPLRPGAPPGHRKRPTHEVHAILSECDWLARNVPGPDTS